MTTPNDPMMSFPLKRTDNLDWVKPMKTYIKDTNSKHLADELTDTFEHLNRLRKAVKEVADGKEKVSEHLIEQVIYPYATLLTHACGHFPLVDGRVRISFTWYDTMNKKKVSLPNVTLEMACLMFNASAVYQSLGASEDHGTAEGLKSSYKFFQIAAGLLDYSREKLSNLTERLTPDLTNEGLNLFQSWTLTSAHHVSYLKARLEMKDKFSVLSKLAMEGAALYEALHRSMSHPAVSDAVDRKWIAFADFYRLVLEARAYQHTADESQKQDAIGEVIARLQKSTALLQEALAISKTLGANYTTFVQQISAGIKQQLDVALNDNEKVYHERVTKPDALKAPERLNKTMGKPTPVVDLVETTNLRDPFTLVTPIHILEAQTSFKEKVVASVNTQSSQTRSHREKIRETINKMGVMGAIGSCEQGASGLPETLHQRIDKIRSSAPTGCMNLLMEKHSALQNLAESVKEINARLLVELEEEAKNDRLLRTKFQAKWSREPSEVVNRDLVQNVSDFKQKIAEAQRGDTIITQKMKDFAQSISQLDLPRAQLDSLVPNAVGSAGSSDKIQSVLAELKAAVSQMEEKENKEKVYLSDLTEMLEKDDQQLPLQLAAAGKEGQENVISAAKQKYDEKIQYIIQGMIDSDNILNRIVTSVETLNSLRQSDQSNKVREQAINSLDRASNMFEELLSNLKEGITFYATLSEATERQKNRVEDFVFARNVQKDDLLNVISREAAHIETTHELMSSLKQLEAEKAKAEQQLQQEKAREDMLRYQQYQQYHNQQFQQSPQYPQQQPPPQTQPQQQQYPYQPPTGAPPAYNPYYTGQQPPSAPPGGYPQQPQAPPAGYQQPPQQYQTPQQYPGYAPQYGYPPQSYPPQQQHQQWQYQQYQQQPPPK